MRSYGLALPSINDLTPRREVKDLTGKSGPVLVTDDDTVIQGSKTIIAWAQAHPASAAPAPVAA